MSTNMSGVVFMNFCHRIRSLRTPSLHLYCQSVFLSTIATLSHFNALNRVFQLKSGLVKAFKGMESCQDGITSTPKRRWKYQRGWWTCQGGCQYQKPKEQFQLWRSKTKQFCPTQQTRCDACMPPEGKTMTCMVNMFCPECSEPKKEAMERFWQTDGRKSRFKNERCLSPVCKKKAHKIGRWLRMQHDADTTIRAWLAQNNCLRDIAKPTQMTLELYCTQPKDAVAALGQPKDAVAA